MHDHEALAANPVWFDLCAEIVPSSHFLPELCPEVLSETLSLTVPPGSFVLLHSALWHRGTPEMAGLRRIMVKLNYVRSETPPRSPSWAHDGRTTPKDPEVACVWNWMAAQQPEPEPDPGEDEEGRRARLELLTAADALPRQRMRAAFELGGRVESEEWVEELLAALPEDSWAVEKTAPAEGAREDWATFSSFPGWGVAMAVSACGPKATGPLLRAIESASGRRKALLLDLLLDCDSAPHRRQRLDCFVGCLEDEEEWVRHTAVQAMEACAQALRDNGGSSALLPLLERHARGGPDAAENDFVVWNAISACRYATPPSGLQVLGKVLEPLRDHASPFLSWKAACTIRELGQGSSEETARL